MRIKQGQPVRSHKIIFESQAGNPCALSIHIRYLEVKPDRSVHFHLYSNFYSEVKPDELAYFRIDSFRKPSRTNRWAFVQLPHSEAKPDELVRFRTKSFPRVKQAILLHSQCKSTFGSKAGQTGTLPHKTVSEGQADNPFTLIIQILFWKLSRTNL